MELLNRLDGKGSEGKASEISTSDLLPEFNERMNDPQIINELAASIQSQCEPFFAAAIAIFFQDIFSGGLER